MSIFRFAAENDVQDKKMVFLKTSCSWDEILKAVSTTFGISPGSIQSFTLYDAEDDDLSQPVVAASKFWKYGANYDCNSGQYFRIKMQRERAAVPDMYKNATVVSLQTVAPVVAANEAKLAPPANRVLSTSVIAPISNPDVPTPAQRAPDPNRSSRIARERSSPALIAASEKLSEIDPTPPPPAIEETQSDDEASSSETGLEFEESELLQAFVSSDMDAVNRLMNCESVHEYDEQHRTLLHMACRQGMTSLASAIVDLGGDPDARDKAGRTPLHYACKYDHLSTVKYLVRIKADLNIADKDNMLALHYACISGCGEIAKVLVESGNVDIDFADKRGNTAVHYCCDTRNYPLAEWLTEVGGANIDKINDDGLSAFGIVHNSGSVGFASVLMEKAAIVSVQRNILNKTKQLSQASVRGEWSTVLNLVLDGAADVQASDENNKSVLSYACESGSLQIVRAIVERGGRIQQKDIFGKTCLHYCCERGHYDVAKYLIVETGRAALNDTDNNGHTELFYACTGVVNSDLIKLLAQNGGDFRSAAESSESQKVLCKALANNRDLVEYLIQECDFDIDMLYSTHDDIDRSTDSDEFYTWAWQVKRRLGEFLTESLCNFLQTRPEDITHAQYLIRRGADVNVVLPMGCCPLHDACVRGQDDYVTFLVKQGALCTATDSEGNTPLHIASYFGHLEIIRWLKKSGAFISAKNNAGYTPLHLACAAAQLPVSKWLVDRGANIHDRSKDGATPFLLACESGDIEVVKWIEPMMKLSLFVPEGDHLNAAAYEPIDHSVKSGNVELVEWWLLKRSCPKSIGANYVTRTKKVKNEKTISDMVAAFRLSCFRGDVESCKKYVSASVNINTTENRSVSQRELAPAYATDAVDPMISFKGVPGLNMCCSLGHEEIVNLLLEQPSLTCSYRDANGRSALHVACLGGFTCIANRLIKTGYFTELQLDRFGNSLLHLSVMSKNEQLVISLAERFALLDEDLKNTAGQSCLDIAAQQGLSAVTNWFRDNPKHGRLIDELCNACTSGNVVVMNRLVSQGADINAGDSDGMRPIHFAAANNQLLVATRLIELKCHLNVLTAFSMSPLHFAADVGNAEIVRCLVYAGADVNLVDVNGMTPFLLCCLHGKVDIASFLMNQGAKSTVINKKGQNALHLSVVSESFPALKFVLESCREIPIDDRDKDGMRPLDVATERFQMEMITCIQCAQIISYEQRVTDLEKKNLVELQKAEERARKQAEIKELYMKSESERELARIQREGEKEENTAMFLDACCKGEVEIVEEMLAADSVDSNCQNKDGFTALHLACIAGNAKLVKLLLQYRSKVDVKNCHGCTALYYACASGNDEIALLLVGNGADYLVVANDGTTPMQCICAKDRAHLLRMLFKRDPDIDVNYRDGSSSSLLRVACVNGSENVALILLKKGALVIGDTDLNRSSLLHLAALTGSVKLSEGLLEHGADICARDDDGFTPLMRACSVGHKKLAEFYVSKGADIHDCDPVGNSCLHLAAISGSTEVCSWLTENGLNIFSFNDDKTNVIVIAKVKRHSELRKWLKSYIISIRAFFEISSSGNLSNIKQFMDTTKLHYSVTNECFASAMHFACGAGELAACKYFLGLGSSVDDVDDEGLTPLHWACAGGHESVFKWLLGRGAKIGHKSHDGRNLLHRAAFHGQSRLLTVLINNRSFPYFIDDVCENGFTPFFDACTSGHLKTAELLLLKGAELMIMLPNGYNILHILCRQGRHVILSWLLGNYSVSLSSYLDSGTSKNGTTPLMCGCISGSVEVLNTLEAHHLDIRTALGRQTRRGDTALHLACFHGHLNAVKWLVHHGADPAALNIAKNTPIKVAILSKKLDVAAWMDDGTELIPMTTTPIELKAEPEKKTGPSNASARDSPQSRRKQLIDPFAMRPSKKDLMSNSRKSTWKSTNVSEGNKDHDMKVSVPGQGSHSKKSQPSPRPDPFAPNTGSAPRAREANKLMDNASRLSLRQLGSPSSLSLRSKASENTSIDSTQRDGSIDSCSVVGERVVENIHSACTDGDFKLVERIVARNPSQIDILNDQGMSPLYIACNKKFEGIALYLIKNGANLNTVCRSTGDTPVHRLCYRGMSKLLNQIIEQPSLGSRLNLDCKSDTGSCPLHIAVSGFGDIDMIKYLLELGADAGAKDSDRMTALHYACKLKKLDVVKELLAWSAPLNSQNNAGNTPLMLAVISDDSSIAKYLVEVKHAALSPKNHSGDTVLHLACKEGRLSMAEWLVVHNGMDPTARNNAKLSAIDCAEMGGFDHLANKLRQWQQTAMKIGSPSALQR